MTGAAPGATPAPPPVGRVLTELCVPVTMRDGTVLRATVTRADDGRPAPVLLVRTPYPVQDERFHLDPVDMVRRGMAVVVQAVRGTGDSEGCFSPWVHEQDDGADTIAWCAAQPWSTGAVATTGRSYPAHVQLFAAAARPPALRAMVLEVVPSDPYDLTYTGGVLALGSSLGWALGVAGRELDRRASRGEDVAAAREAWQVATGDDAGLYRTAPLADLPALDGVVPSWREWLAHPERDAYWQERAVRGRDPVPAFVVAGWFDLFLRGSLEAFTTARHPRSRLVVGPWCHISSGRALGDVDHGPQASAAAAGVGAEALDFLAAELADGPPAADGERRPAVRYFVMGGGGRWRTAAAWPPPGTVDTVLYLRAEGRLTVSPPPDDAGPTAFVSDPGDPVPTVGGPTLLPQGDAAGACGPCDQGVLDGRPDVVRFVSDPLPKAVEIVGEVTVHLHVATSAAGADWVARLVDVHPDGRGYGVCDGIVRDVPAEGAGCGHEVVVRLWPTAQLVPAGHRVRLDVCGSDFPRFDRNPGTGGTTADTPEAAFVAARQEVFHDAARPSRIVLPVLPAARD